MTQTISILPENIANQIAAGEVILRPSSIVKELIENSVDANAKKIQLIIKDSGKTLVQVIDDGIGMSIKDLKLSFQRHTTSKLKNFDDLFLLKSKGFRGEALASIAAIAIIQATSRRKKDEIGKLIKISGGKIGLVEDSVTSVGTSISVKNLFYNVPARRNFLKSDNVELKHIIDEFHRIALAHPEICFVFFQNDSELFKLPISSLQKRIINIFSNKIQAKLIPVEEKTSVAEISGFVIKPDFSKKSRGQQFFFVNNRFIKSPFLNHSIVSAFEGLLSDGFFPGYFIFLKVDPKSIDVNIHPTKTEVKFEDEQNLFAILKATVKHSLGMFQVFPSIDFEKDPGLDVPYEYIRKSPKEPPIEINSSFNPFREEKGIEKISRDSWDNLYSKIESKDSANISEDELQLNLSQSPKVFQLFKKYIITSLRSGLLIINQQRAHQRILYEKFLKSLTSEKMVTQELIFPIKIKLSKKELVLFDEYHKNLKAIGFKIKLSGSNLKIKSAPSIFNHDNLEDIILNLFSMIDDGNFDSFSKSDFLSKALSNVASIKSGRILSVKEQQILVDDLFACKEFLTSPFNHQIFVTLSKEELDEKLN
ncbi:MAG: DNA mismatch repair endonuclease MutL [Flavobacteriaceae bacterium]|jgi:DNA mismatch repair protein MutL|nr:DNA mismatch repair endonuclease MutL [Flavobacteriaceae bacterium]